MNMSITEPGRILTCRLTTLINVRNMHNPPCVLTIRIHKRNIIPQQVRITFHDMKLALPERLCFDPRKASWRTWWWRFALWLWRNPEASCPHVSGPWAPCRPTTSTKFWFYYDFILYVHFIRILMFGNCLSVVFLIL